MAPHLSPATKANFLANKRKFDPKPRTLSLWECAICGTCHNAIDAARNCCGEEEDPGNTRCPVCGTDCGDTREAADCCLWHDIDKPERNRMAEAIAAGTTTWARELGLEGVV